MIKTIKVELNAANPNLPLERSAVFAGSAASFTVLNVPRRHGLREVTAVAVSVTSAEGVTQSFAAVRDGCAWNATVPADAIGAAGLVRNGVVISGSGTDETGGEVQCWVFGAGDLCVMSLDGQIVPGEVGTNLRGFDETPSAPSAWSVRRTAAGFEIYHDGAWRALGGAASVSWDAVIGKPTAFPPSAHASSHAANGSDALTVAQSQVTGLAAALAGKVSSADAQVESGVWLLDEHGDLDTYLHVYTDGQNKGFGMHTIDDRASLTLTGDRWAFQSGDATVEVPRAGGTLALTSEIPAVVAPSAATSSGKAADALAVKNALAALTSSISYSLNADGTLHDRAINALTFTASSASHTFDLAAALPTAQTGKVRDFLIRLVADAKVTFLTGAMDIRGDGLTMEDGAADRLITLTEIGGGAWYVRSIDVAATEE